MYVDVEELDLWTGALIEQPIGDGALGPLLEGMMAKQFTQLMAGDRMFYLWDDELTVGELSEIRNTSLADVIQRNSTVVGLQANVFFVPEPSGVVSLLLALGALLRCRRLTH